MIYSTLQMLDRIRAIVIFGGLGSCEAKGDFSASFSLTVITLLHIVRKRRRRTGDERLQYVNCPSLLIRVGNPEFSTSCI
jgi:hypothetical protein